ncbi:MAG: nucleotidyltransferase domain-containing protein [Ignavibacteriaceae bacterium]|nr:nucleotidyltransferase domain-containing protein [Ignavibacteriaceae bacterium]
MKALDPYIEPIKAICRQYRVKTLFAFGSAVKDKMSPDSDIDFVVEIESNDPFIYTENYFELKFQLEKLLKREIDLLEQKAIKNPFLSEEIDSNKVLVYGN